MVKKIDEVTQKQIAAFLPHAIAKALQSYQDFVAIELEFDSAKKSKSKSFSDHHGACKAAISHLELLLKMAEWAHLTDENAQKGSDEGLARILSQAKSHISHHKDKAKNT